ncbi:Limb region 1 protein homolog [Plakobranchus ocellatus]|uniref:Limb region 1 protein homolog n=1 Tax=Plakobranchus ocellatus TaxID=259542 RepID=A0AAV4E089_9GAST|nr:Limb region 1 protein homolog [Plakobranchus ocellatus]
MLLLLAITVFSILIVIHNIIRLLLGTQSLPSIVTESSLGITSLSYFGSVGAALQIVVILYLMVASVVGFYSLPYLSHLQPRLGETSMVKIIINSVVLLLLSSALPILSKTLGITNFDLLGKFGSMEWLRKFYIIVLYNAVFVVSTALCLFQKFTSPVWREICTLLGSVFSRIRRGEGSAIVGSHSIGTAVSNGGVRAKGDNQKEE